MLDILILMFVFGIIGGFIGLIGYFVFEYF